MVEGSIMPSYAHLLRQPIEWGVITPRVRAMVTLGVPYSPEDVAGAEDAARAQAVQLYAQLLDQGGVTRLEDGTPIENTKVFALIAYLERLGTDIFKTEPTGGE
jgi:cytochrome c oxidase cbb3-type subunit I/II